MKQMLFILNPCAGTKKANRVLTEILTVFSRAGYDVHTYITDGPQDAAAAVTKLGAGMDLIVCCGGDGTFNETVTGVLSSGLSTPIGYIPAGSTNDFAASLKLSTDPLTAALKIVTGQPEQYDVGQFGSRYFAYVASFGAFTRTSYATSQNVKNALGHTAYILSGIQELSQIRKLPVRLELDSETLEDDYIFGAICNSTSVAGILTLDEAQVNLCDGKFEVLLVRAPRSLAELTECIAAIQRQQYNCRMLTFRSATNIKVFSSEDMFWTLDGEKASGSAEISVANLHRAITIMK